MTFKKGIESVELERDRESERRAPPPGPWKRENGKGCNVSMATEPTPLGGFVFLYFPRLAAAVSCRIA